MMNKALTQEQAKIIDFIRKYPDSITDRRRFAALIADIIPDNKPLKNAIISAYEENIIEEIRCGDNYLQVMYRCSRILENSTGLSPNYVKQAVEILICLFGKEEWFNDSIDQNTDACQDFSIDLESVKKKVCQTGIIEYVELKGKIHILNIVCSNNNLSKSIVLIPERIDGCEVVGLFPNSLNSLRYNKCKYMVVPNTVVMIGDIRDGLYSSFDKSKGNSGRIKIYWSKYNYSNYGDDYEFYSALADNISDEIAIREMTSEIVDYLNSNKFMLINNYQNKFGYWSYPQNGMWIYKDSLMFYSGDNEVINVNCCKKVCRGAIAHNAVKEIVFGATVTRFETKMITDCGQLEKITFEADVRCNFSELAILNCKELKCVNWPDIFDFEQISIYAECPKLGNMIRYNRLLTYQSNEKVIIVPPEIEVVNNKAFCSCKKAEIVIIPSGVERVEYEAFDGTSISHVIIEGQYTQWDAHAQCDSVLYVYSKKDSNVMHSVSPFKKYPGLYMKNISCMEPYISDKYDTVGILSKCQNSCDGKSDDEMLVKPYSWEKEIYYKN